MQTDFTGSTPMMSNDGDDLPGNPPPSHQSQEVRTPRPLALLLSLQIDRPTARELLDQAGPNKVIDAVAYAQASNRIRNKRGWVVDCLTHDRPIPTFDAPRTAIPIPPPPDWDEWARNRATSAQVKRHVAKIRRILGNKSAT